MLTRYRATHCSCSQGCSSLSSSSSSPPSFPQPTVRQIQSVSNRRVTHTLDSDALHSHRGGISDRGGPTRTLLRTAVRTFASGQDVSSTSHGEVWQRLGLIKRQLQVAVLEENYSLAAKLRDEIKHLTTALPPIQQYLLRQTSLLKTAGSLTEKLQAIKAMAESGDSVVVPELATCLTDPELAKPAQEAMWTLFTKNADPEINELMVEGVTLMSNPATHDDALKVFEVMIKKDPVFPEAYNKRATLLYIMKQFDKSIEDCQAVLKMQPYHFGAASGMGLCYLMLNRESEAIDAFEMSLRINPALDNIANVLREIKRRAAKGSGASKRATKSEKEDGSGASDGSSGIDKRENRDG